MLHYWLVAKFVCLWFVDGQVVCVGFFFSLWWKTTVCCCSKWHYKSTESGPKQWSCRLWNQHYNLKDAQRSANWRDFRAQEPTFVFHAVVWAAVIWNFWLLDCFDPCFLHLITSPQFGFLFLLIVFSCLFSKIRKDLENNALSLHNHNSYEQYLAPCWTLIFFSVPSTC